VALRGTLKNFIPKKLWNTVNHPDGYKVTALEYNTHWNLNVEQGDDTAQKLKDTLTMLYETVLHEQTGGNVIYATINSVVKTLPEHILDVINNYTSLTQLSTALAPIIAQLNTASANVTTLQGQMAALDNTYSTDAERVAAIQAVINQFQAADGDITAMIANKADTANVYTKAQIDGMALGDFKLDVTTNKYDVTMLRTLIPIGISNFDPTTDFLRVDYLLNGDSKFYDPNTEYTVVYNGAHIQLAFGVSTGSFFFTVFKNTKLAVPTTIFSGSLIQNATVGMGKLDGQLYSLIDGMSKKTSAMSIERLNKDASGIYTTILYKFGTRKYKSSI